MDYLAEIRREGDRFYDLAATADPSRRVPSCPDWDVTELVYHLGEVHWFWGTIVELRATDPDQAEAGKPERPADYGELVAWGRSSLDRLIAFLEASDDSTPVWTWAKEESDHSVGFIRRHQVQETCVHRWDIEKAVRDDAPPDPIAAEAASDAIDEFLAVTLPWSVNADKPLKGSAHLHCTDVEGEWFIHPDGQIERVHKKGDVAVRGTASDLLLALFQRIDLLNLEVIGDEQVAAQLAAVQN